MKRIQRQRTKGWRMPPNTVYVGRPSLWGNPWSLSDGVAFGIPPAERRAWAVRRYQEELKHWGLMSDWYYVVSEARVEVESIKAEAAGAKNMAEYAAVALRGKDLACWCPLDGPCHADVLLEVSA